MRTHCAHIATITNVNVVVDVQGVVVGNSDGIGIGIMLVTGSSERRQSPM